MVKTKREREFAAVLESDVRIELAGRRVTPALLKAAYIRSSETLWPSIKVEIDPLDHTKLNVTFLR